MPSHGSSLATSATRAAPRWLVAALLASLLSSMVPNAADAQPDDCTYGYTPEATVSFGHDADSGVANHEVAGGCTIMDHLMAAAPFANHGGFVATVAREARQLQRDGVLAAGERSDIVQAAARSDIGKPVATGRDRPVPLEDIGVVLFTVRQQMAADPDATLGALAACGIPNVEPSGSVGNYYGLNAAELASSAEAADLNVASIGVSLGNLRDDLDRVIADATTLGASYARFSGPSSWDLDDYVDAAAELNVIGRELADAGITLAYHNHGWEFDELAEGVRGYDVLVRGTDPAAVTFELDTYWAESVGASTVELIRQYPGRFELLHLKDLTTGPDGSPTFADVGEGEIDFAEIFAYAEMGNVQWSFIEHDQPSPDGVTSACNSMANLRELTY